jgi:hypothetical protein
VLELREEQKLRNRLSQLRVVLGGVVDRWSEESDGAQKPWTVPAADSQMSNLADFLRHELAEK